MHKLILFLTPLAFLFLMPSFSIAQKVAVVDVQKVFDGYQKVKEARARLDKSKKIAMEELEIFRAEMEKIVKELKEMEDKIKNPNIDSTDLEKNTKKKLKKRRSSRTIWFLTINERRLPFLKGKETYLSNILQISVKRYNKWQVLKGMI